MKMLQDAIYEKRMKMLNKLKPTLNEGLAGTSGLGLGLLLGSNFGDSEE